LKIIIVTPACNEEIHLPDLISSMVNQSILPVEWIIVDDGSIDNTSNIIKQSVIKYSWITYLRKEKIGARSPGKSVMETFYFGFERRHNLEYDIIIKLDADLVLPYNYMESILEKFYSNKKIGICGGVCTIKQNNQYVVEKETNLDHVRGAIKAYRKQCFIEIGGLLKVMGWDTVDEHTARFLGWHVIVLPELKVQHQRSTHQEYGLFKAAYRNGRMLYTIRMDVFLLLGNCIKKLVKKPYLIVSILMLVGYLGAFFLKEKKIVNKELGRFIRKYRYNKIFLYFFN
tara:strand:- start:444 stop:1301 length:858 start_codon:yes stop_codon:yes gene_type:complete